MLRKLKLSCDEYIEEFKRVNLKEAGILFFIAAIFYFPILLASVHYVDDLYRSVAGTFGWYHLGRPIADMTALFFSSTIDFNKPSNVDPFPLSWFMSITFIVLSGLIIKMKLQREQFHYAHTLAILFVINPFFIHNLLYRFDSTGMFLGLLFASSAFYLKESKNELFLKYILLMLVLLTYQTFFNIFIGLIGLQLLVNSLQEKQVSTNKVVRQSFTNILIAILSALTFFVLSKLFLPKQGAVRSTLMEISWDLPLRLIENYLQAFSQFIEFWSYFIPYIAIILPFVLFAIFKILYQRKNLARFVLSILIIFSSSIGFMAILENQFLLPRGLAYFSIIMMLFATLVIYVQKHLQWLFILPVFACFIFASRVGTAQTEQSKFERPILAHAVMELNQLVELDTIYSINGLPISPLSENIIKRTPFNAFVARNGALTGGRLIIMGAHKVKFQWSGDYSRTKMQLETILESNISPISENSFYKIYIQNNIGYIYWKPEVYRNELRRVFN